MNYLNGRLRNEQDCTLTMRAYSPLDNTLSMRAYVQLEKTLTMHAYSPNDKTHWSEYVPVSLLAALELGILMDCLY